MVESGRRPGTSTTDGHGWTRIYRRKQSKGRGRKFGTENAKRVKKMGAVTKFFDLRVLKVRLCADDLSFAQMAVEARRKAVTILARIPSGISAHTNPTPDKQRPEEQ